MPEPLRLLLRPHREAAGHHTDRFDAFLGEELFITSRQPRSDAARRLLELGHPPETLLTTRHAGKAYDNWNPAPIGELAEWTIVERDTRGLCRVPFRAFPKEIADGPCDVRGSAVEAQGRERR